jgi:hypothetical protein
MDPEPSTAESREPTLVFLDTETTSLDRRTREVWDIGAVRRTPDGGRTEFSALVADVDLRFADEESLKIGRFAWRHPARGGTPEAGTGLLPGYQMAAMLGAEGGLLAPDPTTGPVIWVGAVPWFDEHSIWNFLHRYGWVGDSLPWHYHLVDVETLAAGRLGIRPPWSFDFLLAQFGLAQGEARHTGLGDALLVEQLYDAVMGETA